MATNKIPTIAGGTENAKIPKEVREAEAWKFLKYLTTQPENVAQVQSSGSGCGKSSLGEGVADSNFDPAKNYLEKTKKPAARKDIIATQKEVYRLGIFAQQNLIAKTWIQIDPDATESIMAVMIDDVNRGKFNVSEALKSAVSRINQAVKSTN